MSDEAFYMAAGRHWHPVARSQDVAPGAAVGVTLLGEDLVLWRDHGGGLGLADDLCIHRGTRLSRGTVTDEGCIRCPYHAWEYDRTGACTRIPQLPDGPIPAKARTAAYRVEERAGLVWACTAPEDTQARGIPDLPAVEGRPVYVGEPMDWACQASRQIENFCDMAHFSVVHLDVFGNPEAMTVEDYTVDRSPDGLTLTTAFTYLAWNRMEPDADGKPAEVPVHFDYRIELPFTVALESEMAGSPYTLICATSPVTAESARVFWVFLSPAGTEPWPDQMIELSEQMVFHADRAVVETQRPERVPLDLTAELHLGFDRTAVAYRRALADLGFPVTAARDAVLT